MVNRGLEIGSYEDEATRLPALTEHYSVLVEQAKQNSCGHADEQRLYQIWRHAVTLSSDYSCYEAKHQSHNRGEGEIAVYMLVQV